MTLGARAHAMYIQRLELSSWRNEESQHFSYRNPSQTTATAALPPSPSSTLSLYNSTDSANPMPGPTYFTIIMMAAII